MNTALSLYSKNAVNNKMHAPKNRSIAGYMLCTLLCLSLQAIANEETLPQSSASEAQEPKAANNATLSQIDTQTCPNNFYDVKLPSNGKLCQVFASDLPASMIFFVPQNPSEVVAFYKQDPSEFTTTKQVKQRYLLQSDDKNTTLIISNDGKGTQVDVLVIGELKGEQKSEQKIEQKI